MPKDEQNTLIYVHIFDQLHELKNTYKVAFDCYILKNKKYLLLSTSYPLYENKHLHNSFSR